MYQEEEMVLPVENTVSQFDELSAVSIPQLPSRSRLRRFFRKFFSFGTAQEGLEINEKHAAPRFLHAESCLDNSELIDFLS